MEIARKIQRRTANRGSLTAGQTAAPAVNPKNAFTIIEVLVVVVIIGILSGLAYASLADMIFSNRAKETAHVIRSFTERALTDAKRQNQQVKIELKNNTIIATMNGTVVANETLGSGYKPEPGMSIGGINTSFNDGVLSEFRIGLSGISGQGYFAACDTRKYCGGAVKSAGENGFKAYIRKGGNATWEAL